MLRALVSLALLTALANLPQQACGAIVFSALEDGRWHVYWQAELNATPQLVVKDESGDQTSARFGTDGSSLAFENSRNEILVLQKANQQPLWSVLRTITNSVRPAWHAGISNWVFMRFTLSASGEDSDIFFFRSTARGPETLVRHTGNQDYPHVSLDGSKLVYTSTQVVSVRQGAVDAFQQLWIVDFQRGETRLLLADGRENIEAAWSPSGQEIAFASNRGGNFDIWIIQADGSGLRQITKGPGTNTRPAWSPDGKRLIFTHSAEGRYGLALIGAEGKNFTSYKPFGDRRRIELRDADWK